MLEFTGASREDALRAKDCYGRVSQRGTGDRPPYWYGQVIEVHPSGDYLKFSRRQGSERWYHRRDVSLHPDRPDAAQACSKAPHCPCFDKQGAQVTSCYLAAGSVEVDGG